MMRVSGIEKVVEFSTIYPDAEVPLNTWIQIAEQAEWRHIMDVRQVYPHADFVEGYTVFNIGGNKYRLVTKITYIVKTINIRYILTHNEYDEEKWKN